MGECQGKISYFKDSVINEIALPKRFTFPFYYEPHPLAKIAVAALQQYLAAENNLDHNFGLTDDKKGPAIGKMFGILVVQDTEGKLGYLSAFSGKLAGTNNHSKFVPPVFDMLVENSFFLQEEEIINTINARITEIQASTNYQRLKPEIEQSVAQYSLELEVLKQQLKINKKGRDSFRTEYKNDLNKQDYDVAEAELVKQSLYDKRQLKELTNKWKPRLDELQARLAQFEIDIETLKNERKERSATLQQQLFEQYVFLNQYGKNKSLHEIFKQTAFGKPPSAAGECALPKLLQFSFKHKYKPLAMAEFWWGASPKAEIRKHKHFYPACTGKCKPILAHMLEGIPIDENPFLRVPEEDSLLKTIYEDESIIVVNKPAGLRSVPGVDISDSVYTRLKDAWMNTQPLIVHRLDMSTSGLLVVAKTRQAHKHIQKQFLRRAVSKRYTALVAKVIEQTDGAINLPLRGDLFNRPRQLVCFETGKKSITLWEVVERYQAMTKINFWPLTGRTHQLRMHSAHELGLNAPIVGDELYGTPSERMYLHAAYIEFVHPGTGKKISFVAKEDFLAKEQVVL